MASRSKSFIFLHVDEEEQHVEISDGYMVHQWVTQGIIIIIIIIIHLYSAISHSSIALNMKC
jgi:hypothetical protein